MTIFQRAMQLWPLLAWSATNRQVLTYDLVSKLTGIPKVALGKCLCPIHEYCRKNKMPALTSIVVNKKTGLPGRGFHAAKDIASEHMKVFDFDWFDKYPSLEELEKVYRERENG